MVAIGAPWGTHVQANDASPNRLESAEYRAMGFLKSLPREWTGTSARDCKTYENKNIEKLSTSFAVSAAAFLRAFVEIHGSVTITSAYRTAEEQACVCEGEKGPCAGRPRIVKAKKGRRIVKRGTSHHQDGIALDVRAGTGSEEEFACMHEFAQFNPQFGVRFPMGKRDHPHMEPDATARRNVQLAALGAVQSHVTPCAKMRIMLTDDPVD
jgi:D-alanyl-D-alanine carboxypeptidase